MYRSLNGKTYTYPIETSLKEPAAWSFIDIEAKGVAAISTSQDSARNLAAELVKYPDLAEQLSPKAQRARGFAPQKTGEAA